MDCKRSNKFMTMPKLLIWSIKILSTVLIIGFLGIAGWNFYARANNAAIIDLPQWGLWWGYFAIFAHFLEAIAAAIYAYFQQKNALLTGIYVFFVGTVGLGEVFEKQDFQRFFCKSS